MRKLKPELSRLDESLFEETSEQLIKSTWKRVVLRVDTQHIVATYITTDRDGTMHFWTTSGTHPGRDKWRVDIKFKNFEKVKDLYRTHIFVRQKKVIKMLLSGDIQVYCNCHMWRYYCAYVATKEGYAIRDEHRPAPIRNPHNDKLICKHTVSCIYLMQKEFNKIFSELVAKGVMTKEISIIPKINLDLGTPKP